MTNETPESYPALLPCYVAGHKHLLNDCPNWVAVPENIADAKYMMALGGFSISTTYQRTEK